jgi:hypothetical protein
MTPGQGYLNALGAANVQVIKQSVTRLTTTGIIDDTGAEHAVDAVVFATGFGHLFQPHFTVTGRNGTSLSTQFGDAPHAYLAITAANFPNLFLMLGPNGPVSHGSLLPIFEWHTRYMLAMVGKLQRENMHSFAPTAAAVGDFHAYTHTLLKRLVWSGRCGGWFKNGRSDGPVTAVWAGSRLHYFELLREVRWEDYEVRYRTANRFQFLGNGYTDVECGEGDPVWYLDVLRAEDGRRRR